MPQASKTESRVISDTALPYVSNTSITNTTPHLIQGSQNVMTSLRKWMECRPGFSLEFDTTSFSSVQRNFVWRRWSGSTPNGGRFVWMISDLVGGVAKVYKKVIGVDAAPALIWTSTSSEPFDFVVSNNTCYFGNGTDMKKFDSSTLSNWGITAPLAGPGLALLPAQFVLSAAANASAGSTVYTGTITGGGANAYAGLTFVIAGFATGANNGSFPCTASSATTLTLTNAGGVAEAHAATATDTAAANVFTSWCYCYTYYNSSTTHESSPSPISACSGLFANKKVQLSVTASADPQVTNIRVYRTPDGGAQGPALMQEVSGSPFPNSTTTQIDSTPDTSLSIRVAPEFLRNDPPTPAKGFVHYAGRIWGFYNNVTSYSGLEEISNGVPEECWPSGLSGNFYPWANEVMAHATLVDGIAVFQATSIQKIEGDSLDTFRRYTLLEKRGTRSRTSVCAVGGSVAWLDTSNTIWLSDLGEIGVNIRPDTSGINPATCWITIHISGIYHWVMVLDGTNGILYVYDLDRSQWMPPWTLNSSASALFSGETSLGIINLLLARGGTKNLQLVSGTFSDDGTTYIPVAKTSLYPLTPEDNSSWQGTHDWSDINTDAVPPSQVLRLTDDDPTQATYQDISTSVIPSPLQTQGVYMQSYRYPDTPLSASYVSMMYIWPQGKNFHLYEIADSYHPAGG